MSEGVVSGMSERRPAVDVARVVALATVVIGHLAMAIVDRDAEGAIRGTNLFTLHPQWAWSTVISPMPVFFVAAGYANAGSTMAVAATRTRTLVGLAATVLGSWSAAVVAAELVTGGGGSVVSDGARLATQPLWFIAAYVPLVTAAAAWSRSLAAHPLEAAIGCAGIVAVSDVSRFVLGAPDWAGWPGFLAAWAVPWCIGAWWRGRDASSRVREDGRDRSAGEVRSGLALAAGGVLVATLLVRHGGYVASMLDVDDGARSNSTPPNLYTVAISVAQGGAVMVCAGWLDRVGRRWHSAWSRAGAAALGVYAWHLTGFALCAAVLAAGLPAPERFTTAWWVTRPLWWAGILAVTMVMVVLTRRVMQRTKGSSTVVDGPRERAFTVAGTVLAGMTAAAVGLRGPRTATWAVVLTVGMGIAWWFLRAASTATPSRDRR